MAAPCAIGEWRIGLCLLANLELGVNGHSLLPHGGMEGDSINIECIAATARQEYYLPQGNRRILLLLLVPTSLSPQEIDCLHQIMGSLSSIGEVSNSATLDLIPNVAQTVLSLLCQLYPALHALLI